MRIVFAALLFVSMTTMGLADRQAADACATKLTPISKQIYEGTLAQNPTPETGRNIYEVNRMGKVTSQNQIVR